MKFKLDENFDPRLVPLIAKGGHDVDTVLGEGISGAKDEAVYRACRETGRTLVTLDLDFSNPLRFPPGPTEGIVIVRPPRPVLPLIRATLMSALPELKSRVLRGKLWIAEPARIRVYDPADELEGPWEETTA
jgi:predicted nuclease of predicted toxin-antitoxin system